MAKEKATAVYEKTAAQVDLERRQENGNKSDLILSTAQTDEPVEDPNARVFQLEGNETENFIGVDPVYQNYASDSQKPLRAEEGSAEAELEAQAHGEHEEHFEVPTGFGDPKPVEPQRVVIAGIEDGVAPIADVEDLDNGDSKTGDDSKTPEEPKKEEAGSTQPSTPPVTPTK